jgi:dGTPase
VALDRLMQGEGGFEHNRQSLRIVEELEQKYPLFAGLNLTWEVREGLVKHRTSYDHPDQRDGFEAQCSSLEAQVANLADEITYYSHDLDDGLESGLLTEAQLSSEVGMWAQASETVRLEYGELPDECRRYFIIRCLIDGQVRDVVETAEGLIRDSGVKSADEVRLQPGALVQYSVERRRQNLQLRDYLYANLYYNPEVQGPNLRAVRMLEELFNHYLAHHEEVGEQSRKRAERIGWWRAVCDYLAGMTDRYAMLEYQRLLGA